MIVMYRSRDNIVNALVDKDVRNELLNVLGDKDGVWIVEGDEDEDITYTDINGIFPYSIEINERVTFLLCSHHFIRVYYRGVDNPISNYTTNIFSTLIRMNIVKWI